MFAAEIRRKHVLQLRAFSKWKWHVDEVFVTVNKLTRTAALAG